MTTTTLLELQQKRERTQLSADDIERAVSLLTNRSVQYSRCFKWNNIIIVPPSVFVFNAFMGTWPNNYGDRMGIPWLMKRLAKNAHQSIVIFVHLTHHWSLLVRTTLCQWYMVDSLLSVPSPEHLAIASFIEQGQSHLMVCSPLIKQESNWECGYLVLFAFERLLQAMPASQWASTLSNHHGRQKLIGQFTYVTAIERAESLIPPPLSSHHYSGGEDGDDVIFMYKK